MKRPAFRSIMAAAAALLLSATTQVANAADAPDKISDLIEQLRVLETGTEALPGDLACRSENDAIADQVMRLHTQLMVASLACSIHYGDEASYVKYRLFTRQHADLIRQSQATLEDSLSESGPRAFDTYRTNLANGESSIINSSSTPSYCRMRKSRFNSLIVTNPDQFPGYARELAVRDRIYKSC